MQSSSYPERKSQKHFFSLQPNRKEINESSFENKENISSNSVNKSQATAEAAGTKDLFMENAQKNSEKLSSKKANTEKIEACFAQEIEEIIGAIDKYEINSLNQTENNSSKGDDECEFSEISKTEKLSLNANDEADADCIENKVSLANRACAKEKNMSEFSKRDYQVSENVESSSSDYYVIESKDKKINEDYGNSLKHLFRCLFAKLEKLLEMQREAAHILYLTAETTADNQHTALNFNSAAHNFENKNNNNLKNNNNYQNSNSNINENISCYVKPQNEEDASECQNKCSYSTNSTTSFDEILTKVNLICSEKRFFSELMNFYLKTSHEVKAIDLFLLKSIVNFNDYEEAVFYLAEDLTRNLAKIELLFKILQYAVQNFVFSLYPVFSVCLHKLVKSSYTQEAFVLKNYMLHFKLEISTLAINSLLEALGKSGRIDEAVHFIKEIQNTNFIHLFQGAFSADDSNESVNNVIYVNYQSSNSNYKINNFTKLSFQSGLNLVSYGILIRHLCKSNLIETALVYYEYLKSNKLIKDEIIFNLLIDGCSKASNLSQISRIYKDMIDLQIKPSIVTFNTIIDYYVRAKDLISAWRIYEDISRMGCAPDNFTYSTLFRGIRNSDQHKEYLQKAFLILEELNNDKSSVDRIDIILLNVLIDSCICLKDENNLVLIFHNVVSGFYKNLSPDIITFNTFIKGCAQLNLFEQATNAFNILLSKQDAIEPNDVSFNTMIDVYVRSENINLVWGLLDLMKKYGIKPDNFTYSTIIKGINKKSNFNACSGSNGYNSSRRKFGCDRDDDELQMAFNLFSNVKMYSKPDEILYNCIMDACLRFDKIDKMMEYHEEMIRVIICFLILINYLIDIKSSP